jgi:hypothetical protein
MSTDTPAGITPASAAQQAASTTTTLLSSADTISAERVQSLSLVHQARVSRLTRVANSVTAQFGAKSAQAVAAQRDLSSAQTTAARLASLQRQAATPAPAVAAGGWALHGRVYSAQLQPQTGYTVFFVDEQKAYHSNFGFAYTDSSGYFLINVAPKAVSTSSRKTSKSSRAATIPSSDVFVEIVNAATQPVFLSAQPFQPDVGNAVYQNITLPVGQPVLGDLPEVIRRIALPPKDRSS